MRIFTTAQAIAVINQSKYKTVEFIKSANMAELNDIRRLLTDAFRCNIDRKSPTAIKNL